MTPIELGKLFEKIAQPDKNGFSQAFSVIDLAYNCEGCYYYDPVQFRKGLSK